MSLGIAGSPFQECGFCRKPWSTWQEFVLDPGVRMLGLQPVQSQSDANLLIFEHSCGSSISILARRLRPLLQASLSEASCQRLESTPECRGRCLRLDDLDACDMPCSNARDRELLLLVRRMKRELEESQQGE